MSYTMLKVTLLNCFRVPELFKSNVTSFYSLTLNVTELFTDLLYA